MPSVTVCTRPWPPSCGIKIGAPPNVELAFLEPADEKAQHFCLPALSATAPTSAALALGRPRCDGPAARYERKSLALTANQPFSGWDQVFPEPAMTLAAVDRLVHHSTIFELNVSATAKQKTKEKTD